MSGSARSRWISGAVAVYAVALLAVSWLLLNKQDRDPLTFLIVKSIGTEDHDYRGAPTMLGLFVRAVMVSGACCAVLPLHRIRKLGFIALWWIPFLFAAVLTGAFGLPLPRSNDQALAVIAGIALIEAVVISVWLQPWVGRILVRMSAGSDEVAAVKRR